MRRKYIALFLGIVGFTTLYQALQIPSLETLPLSSYYIDHAFSATGSENVVTSIYLFFRSYDTLFEALMLLFSIIGVIYMSIHEGEHYDE
jgi:multicomponent Na+:H+ antiporter subunit B